MVSFFEIDLSVPDVFEKWENIEPLIPKKESGIQPIIILSNSIGQTKRLLENVVDACYNKGQAQLKFQSIVQFHLELISSLNLNEIIDNLNDLFIDGEWTIEDAGLNPKEYTYDQIVPLGELAGSMILSSYLNSKKVVNGFLDMRDFIKTTDKFGQAQLLEDKTQENFKRRIKLFKDQSYFVSQQHVGSTLDNLTTFLSNEINWTEKVLV